jgi:hypothetical protein
MNTLDYLEIIRKYRLSMVIKDAQGFIDKIHYQTSGDSSCFILTNEYGTSGVMTPNQLKHVITYAIEHNKIYKIALEPIAD